MNVGVNIDVNADVNADLNADVISVHTAIDRSYDIQDLLSLSMVANLSM